NVDVMTRDTVTVQVEDLLKMVTEKDRPDLPNTCAKALDVSQILISGKKTLLQESSHYSESRTTDVETVFSVKPFASICTPASGLFDNDFRNTLEILKINDTKVRVIVLLERELIVLVSGHNIDIQWVSRLSSLWVLAYQAVSEVGFRS
ncbi:hypothetical protein STEG23_025133, partial [Scotinomys teguina]